MVQKGFLVQKILFWCRKKHSAWNKKIGWLVDKVYLDISKNAF